MNMQGEKKTHTKSTCEKTKNKRTKNDHLTTTQGRDIPNKRPNSTHTNRGTL